MAIRTKLIFFITILLSVGSTKQKGVCVWFFLSCAEMIRVSTRRKARPHFPTQVVGALQSVAKRRLNEDVMNAAASM